MLKALITVVFCATATLASAQSFDVKKATYVWPTNASQLLSATFAETRAAHFHAGIDIKTWGTVGYNMLATRDGVVYRILTGPNGYGHAIYLKHEDQSFSLYAHLDGFATRIQAIADSIRLDRLQFDLDEVVESLNIRVKQGQLIGYSGSSGIGPPHIHFEIRSPIDSPINPLLSNLRVKDTLAPIILGILLEPLAPHSEIEGQSAPYYRSVLHKDRIQASLGKITATGPVGIALDAYDIGNDSGNKYAVYELELKVDGQRYFYSRVDSFQFDQTRQMFIDRNYALLQRERKGMQRMWVDDGNRLPFYETNATLGRLMLPEGQYTIDIMARDAFGNTSRAKTMLHIVPSKQVNTTIHTHAKLLPNTSSSISSPFTLHRDWISSIEPIQDIHVDGSYAGQKLALGSRSGNYIVPLQHTSQLRLNYGNAHHSLFRIVPHRQYHIRSDDQRLEFDFPRNAFFDSLSIRFHVKTDSLEFPLIHIEPRLTPVQKAFTIRYLLDEHPLNEKLWMYYLNLEKNTLEALPTSVTRAIIEAKSTDLGTFILLPDTTAPRLKNPRTTTFRMKKFVVAVDVEEEESGFDYKKASFSVNGIPGIPEYDADTKRLIYYHPTFKRASSYFLEIQVADRAGNVAQLSTTIKK